MAKNSRFWIASATLCAVAACGSVTVAAPWSPPAAHTRGWLQHQAVHANPSYVYKWLDLVLEATARDVDRGMARPTIISRQVAIAATAMYDAWAAYDSTAVGSRLGDKLRRPQAEHTAANKTIAVGQAAYVALADQFPADIAWLQQQAKAQGLDPAHVSTDPTTPQGVGNLAARALLQWRRNDGANQHGDEAGGSGKPYSDWTYYAPTSTPQKGIDPDRWMPIPFDDGKGGTVRIGHLTPHWYRVVPFALQRGDQFRPGPPPKGDSDQLRRETEECVQMNGNLTLEQKAIVEFMRDGPRSTGQSGHWLRFAQDVARRDKLSPDQEIKLFFVIANVCFDAFIASWDAKRFYDSSRPYWYVRHFYKGKKIMGYAGPGKGFAKLPAEEWMPYSPATFVTPPFPGYTSGHSTVSGAAAKMLELFTGSDRYEAVERRKAGGLTEPGLPPPQIQARNGQPATGLAVTTDVDLAMPTFTSAAEMAGISRVLGGYHIQADNVAGLALGRTVAKETWATYQAYFAGKATVRP